MVSHCRHRWLEAIIKLPKFGLARTALTKCRPPKRRTQRLLLRFVQNCPELMLSFVAFTYRAEKEGPAPYMVEFPEQTTWDGRGSIHRVIGGSGLVIIIKH